jgi:hypothetical protein
MSAPDPYRQPRTGWEGYQHPTSPPYDPRGPSFGGPPPPGPHIPPKKSSGAMWAVIGGIATLVSLLLAFLAWQYPRPAGLQPTSKEERAPYINQVDAICRQIQPGLVALGPPPTDPGAGIVWFAEQARLHRELLILWSQAPYPEQDEALIRQILDPLEQLITRVTYASQALSGGDLQLANDHIGRANDLQDEFQKNARAYGFRSCQDL